MEANLTLEEAWSKAQDHLTALRTLNFIPVGLISKQQVQDRYCVRLSDDEFTDLIWQTEHLEEYHAEQFLEDLGETMEGIIFPQLVNY